MMSMEKNDYIESIHRYLHNEMEEPERREFELEMSRNNSLKQDVLTEKKLLLGLELLAEEALRGTIREVGKNLEEQGFFEQKDNLISIHSTKNKSMMNRIVAIAAAAAILLGLSWWFFLREPSIDSNAAFAQYFKPEKAKLDEIMAGFSHGFADTVYNAQDTLENALQLYEDGKYNEACEAFDSILVKYPANDTAQFYLAMGHLNAERYARAIELLSSFSPSESSPFYFDSKWYLGLCYLKAEGGLPKAKEIFAELSKNAAYQDRQNAQGLLRMIEK